MLKKAMEGFGLPNATSKKGFLGFIRASFTRDKLGELLVLSGRLSPQDLKKALSHQKQAKRPLGEILVDLHFITQWQLRRILLRQQVLRFAAAFFLCAFSFIGGPKKVRADVIEDLPARMSIISAQVGNFEALDHAIPLFGSEEKRSDNLSAFTKWIGMFETFEATWKYKSSQKIIKEIQTELAGYKSDSIRDMAEKVNTMMNRQKYILDQKNWGKSDYWATPIEFMMRGGDCEDFAIAKYFALRALGVPESRLRVAIVHDEKKNIPHAILIVYAEHGPLVLDNQNKKMLSDNSILHYRPIFSINREGWWLHTAPETTLVASVR